MQKTKLHKICNQVIPELLDDLLRMVMDYVGRVVYVEELVCRVEKALSKLCVPVPDGRDGILGAYYLNHDAMLYVEMKTGTILGSKKFSVHHAGKKMRLMYHEYVDGYYNYAWKRGSDQRDISKQLFRLEGEFYQVMWHTDISEHCKLFHAVCVSEPGVPGVDLYMSKNCDFIHGMYEADSDHYVLWSAKNATFLSIARF